MGNRFMVFLLLLAIALPCAGMHVTVPSPPYTPLSPQAILDYPHVGPIKSRVIQLGQPADAYLLYLGAGNSGVVRSIFVAIDNQVIADWTSLKDSYLNIYIDAGDIANTSFPPAANLAASIPMASFLGAAYYDPAANSYRYESKHHAIRIRASLNGGFELNLPIPYSNGILVQLWHNGAPSDVTGMYSTVTYEDGDLPEWQYKDWRLRSSVIFDDPKFFISAVDLSGLGGPTVFLAADMTEFTQYPSSCFYGLAAVQNPQHMQAASDSALDDGVLYPLKVTGLDSAGVTREETKDLDGTTPVVFDGFLWKSIVSVTAPVGAGNLSLGPSSRVKAEETIRTLASAAAGYLVGLFTSMRSRAAVAEWLYLENNWTFTPDGGTPMEYSGAEDLFGVPNAYYFTAGEEGTPFHGYRYGATAMDTANKWVDGAFRWFDDDSIQWDSTMLIDFPNTDGAAAAADAQICVLYYGP